MTVQPTNQHGWPGRRDVSRLRAKHRTPTAERFGDRGGLVLVAAAERHQTPERWGLGVALAVVGPAVAKVQLIIDDDLEDRCPAALASLRAWAAGQIIETPAGPVPVEVVTRRAFCDPDSGLILRSYTGGAWLVTADEGRTLGLLADHWAPGTRRYGSGFSLGVPGWGEDTTWTTPTGRERSGWRPLLHRPPLRVMAMGAHGLRAEFGRAGRGGHGPDGEPAGHWEKGRPFLGRVVDVIGPAHALDGIDTGELGEHLRAFGLPRLDVPAAVRVDPDGATQVLEVAHAVHQLTLALDGEAARWLTTWEDLQDGRAVVGLQDLMSPGTLASRLLGRAGGTPPLAKFPVPDDPALDPWTAAAHGGWLTSDIRGQLLPVVDADVRSAYPAAWSLLQCWRVLTAKYLQEQDATEEVVALCERLVAADMSPLFDPITYSRLGLTRCEVLPDGEPWPVERPGANGPRFDVAPLRSDVPMPVVWADVALVAILSGRLPRIVSATRLVPYGTEDGLRPLPLRDGVVVPASEDPVPALVRLRPPKGQDDRLRACIRGVANSLAWGVFARLDQARVGGKLRETPAAWTWPPVAAAVPAVARLWLAMVELQVTDLGGAVVTRDTDGLAILASPEGDKVVLPDGPVVRVLSWEQVDAILVPFDALDPFGDGGHFWSVERGDEKRPLHLLSLGPKRYILARSDGADGFVETGGADGFVETGGTEHSLGGGVVDPPALAGRDEAGRHIWTRPVAQRVVDITADPMAGWSAPWDSPGEPPFPVLRRFTAGSPGALADLAPGLGAHPFASLVEAQPDKLYGDPGAPRALDPGTNLADWTGLGWLDADGEPVRVGTEPGHRVDVVLRQLGDFAYTWTRPLPEDPTGLVEVDPRLIRRVGRGGALIDALLADPEARVEDHQVLYDGGDAPGFVVDVARKMGPRPFARAFGLPLRTVTYWTRGDRHPHATSIDQVLAALVAGTVAPTTCPACGAAVWRPASTYCSARCRHTEKARRQRARAVGEAPGCAYPGCDEKARRRAETCSPRHYVALARLRAGAP